MDVFDFYFKEVVTQGVMDWAFDRVQTGMHGLSLDNGLTGILGGLGVQQHAPMPDKSVDVIGPGYACDPEGQRIYIPDALTVVDCSQDEFGTDTNPPTLTFERYISIFARFKRDLTAPALDGNNITVWTKQLESFELFVRIGAEAAAGTAVPAPLMADAVLLMDILVTNGFTAIINADMDDDRREDWVRYAGTSIGDRVYGTPAEAVSDILALIDAWGGAMPFAFTQDWYGAVPVGGPAPPPTTFQTALDALVYDLGAAGPPAGDTLISATDFTGVFFAWAAQSIASALATTAGAIDAHIGGAPPAHPASSITFTPYLYLAAVDVQNAIQELVDDLANITAAGGATRIGNDAYSWIAATTLRGQIQEIVDDLAAQGAGVSGASRSGTEPIAGSPESLAASTVMAALTAIYGHLNARTERASAEVVSGQWTFENGLLTVPQAREANNARFDNNPLFKAIQGGSSSPYHKRGNIASSIVTAGVSWAHPWGGANSVAVGVGAAQLADIKMTYSAAGNRRLVFAESNTFALGWMDPMDPTVFGSIPLAGFFPGGGTTYTVDAICTDAQYVYVKVSILTGAVVTHHVNAFDLAGVLHPGGWAATGTVLAGTGTSPFIQSHTGNICVAQLDAAQQLATTLATVNDWQNGGSGLMVSILNAATGAIVASGDGDVPALPGPYVVANEYPQGGICSDGTNVWFTFRETGGGITRGGFATATIANPLVGSGLASLPYGIPVADSNCILFDGDVIWFVDWTGVLYLYRVADAVIDYKTNATAAIGEARFAVCDGLNVWVQDLEATNDTIVLHQIPCAQVLGSGSGAQDVAQMIRFSAGFSQLSEAAAVPHQQMGRLCFDGDSIWMAPQSAGGGALSGVVRRLPRAGLR